MNIFVIPSWYPSDDQPHTGIFIKEQSLALAETSKQNNIGISTWGSHNNTLLLEKNTFYSWPVKIVNGLKMRSYETSHAPNCKEYFTPAFTWSRMLLKGNIRRIIAVNEAHLNRFTNEFGKVDIIHAHVAHPGGLVAMILGKKYGIPYVISEHMSPFPLPAFDLKGQLHPLIREPYLHASRNIAVSKALSQTMESKGVPNLTVINNLTDEGFFCPADQQRKPGPFRFAFVGRMESQKGLKYLLEALKMLKDSNIHFSIVMGGNGTELAALQARATEWQLVDSIAWTGTLTREGVKTALQNCDAFVLPSIHENHPLVLLEALAMAKPIIATRCGGSEEIVSPEVGLAVERANSQQLYQAMKQLAQGESRFEAEVVRQYFMDRFSKRVIIEQLERLYKQVIDDYSRG